MWSALSFAAPWALSALILLPALWWLLRLVPPAPRRQIFPAVGLLLGLLAKRNEAARTPRWLLALRLLLASLLIAAAAHPIVNVGSAFDGALLVVVDNGWASARQWSERREAIDRLLDQAERSGRPAAVLHTAPGPDGKIAEIKPGSAALAKAQAGALAPRPWETDRAMAAKVLGRFEPIGSMRVVWFTDGIGDQAAEGFGRTLSRLGPLEAVIPAENVPARILTLADGAGSGEPALLIRRGAASRAETVAVRALDMLGRVLMRKSVDLAPGQTAASVALPMPTELRNRVQRFDVEGEESAASLVLLDDRFKHRAVGLVDRGASSSPLLDDLHYADRALSPLAELRRGGVSDLLRRDLSMILLPDAGALGDDEQAKLARWVEGGGVLVRIAGPKLARNPDDLLPVRLLSGGRTLGGAMSWTRPMAVAPIGDGPLAGLEAPRDLLISAQVLAEPSVDLAAKSWARLTDGTPLVTGAPRGKGWVVLVHTTAGPAWSNLGLSGLFPEMLGRFLDLSRGYAAASLETPLAPLELMDGYGHLSAAAGIAESLPAVGSWPRPGPSHPPGYYGTDQGKRAFNLGATLADPRPLALPNGAKTVKLGERPIERDLQPPLLIAAFVLLLLDMAAALWLKGAFARNAALLILVSAAILGAPQTGQAAAPDKATQAALQTRLAYVVTGDAAVDEVSRAGLKGLSLVVARRTTTVLDEPQGVDVETDALAVYPLLYWPVTDSQTALGPMARERINDYLRNGGMILFDTRDRGLGGTSALARLAKGIDIPPLAPVTEAHVLTHSFYILREFPGRYAGGTVYAQEGGDPANDNVSSVVVGGGDWAGAWALERNGLPMFATAPGGEAQREMAFRFGVNLVMYALTGSYKADQVHLPAILERLKR